MNFSNIILNWYAINGRELPWRQTTDPYGLLSTISLENSRYIYSEFGYFGFILLIFNDLEYNKCQI